MLLGFLSVIPTGIFATEISVQKTTPDIWIIETGLASATNPTAEEAQKITARRRTQNGWETVSVRNMYGEMGDNLPILIYVHGNRATAEDAITGGEEIMKHLPADKSYRLIIWHWDTQKSRLRVKNEYAEKAYMADFQGVYFAHFVQNIPSNTRVTLIGYSFGARTVLNGLHLLGGGQFAGQKLPINEQNGTADFCALLLASATDNTDLAATGRFSLATKSAQNIYVTVNAIDPALKFYPKISPLSASAMGITGAVYAPNPDNNAKIKHLPVSKKTHKMKEYIALPNVHAILNTPF